MPEINQYTFKHQELLAALIKQAGLHEGKWQLIIGFNLIGANIGTEPGTANPSAIVTVSTVGLQKARADSPPELVADAAVVNPAST